MLTIAASTGPPVSLLRWRQYAAAKRLRHEVTLEVDVDDRVPLLLGHVEAHLVAEDPGVVDEDVEPAELVDRLRDQRLAAVPGRDVVEVGDGLPAGGDDLVDDLLGRALVRALTASPRRRGR